MGPVDRNFIFNITTMKVILALALIAPAVFGAPMHNRTTMIVGGQEATPNSWPWQLSLQYRGSHTCGGSIWNDEYIITAAHCVSSFFMSNPANWEVHAGKHDISKTESTQQVFKVSRIIAHEGYSSLSQADDIALMKIQGSFTWTDAVKPAGSPGTNPGSMVGEEAYVTGWGTTSEGGSIPDKLMEVDVPIISNSDCQTRYSQETITSKQICAGYTAGGKDSCQGDSGGPLVAKSGGKWIQLGVVSYGYGCARPFRPGVYTRVSEYINWINTNTK